MKNQAANMFRPAKHPNPQRGVTLLVTMIMLILLSLFALTAFNTSTGNMRVIGNMQIKLEALAAATQAIEQTISADFFTTSPDAVAASPVLVDIDNNGTTDYTAKISPKPSCFRSRIVKNDELKQPATAAAWIAASALSDVDFKKQWPEVACMSNTKGGGGDGENSWCADSEWNVRAVVDDVATGTHVAINQGVAKRVLTVDAVNSCL